MILKMLVQRCILKKSESFRKNNMQLTGAIKGIAITIEFVYNTFKENMKTIK